MAHRSLMQVYLTRFNLLIFKIFTNFLVCSSGNYVEQQRAAVSEGRSPLLNKEDHHLSLGSSYDSVSNDEEDVEEQLDVSTKLVNEAEADNTRCLCAVCCDVQRDSFFLPCGVLYMRSKVHDLWLKFGIIACNSSKIVEIDESQLLRMQDSGWGRYMFHMPEEDEENEDELYGLRCNWWSSRNTWELEAKDGVVLQP